MCAHSMMLDSRQRAKTPRLQLLPIVIPAVLAIGCVSELPIPSGTDYDGEGIRPSDDKSDYISLSARWPNPEISVCWENPTNANARERQLVIDALAGSWELASTVRFIGWEPCASDSWGIRIQIQDAREYAHQLGVRLDGVPNGVVLNFTYENYLRYLCGPTATPEQRDSCIQIGAIHEFGHALGFSHEQNRLDTPDPSCAAQWQGEDGDYSYGAWDPDSVMNYCNESYLNRAVSPWVLSAGDANAVHLMYDPVFH